MARLISGGVNSRQIKGKLGEQVFKIVNRETVIAAYQPKVANPRTVAQMIVRRKFAYTGKAVARLNNYAFKRYGLKYPGTNVYSAVSKLAFNNPVVLAMGSTHNFYPKDMPNVQDTLGFNTKVVGTGILEYFAVRKIGTTIRFGFSVPKSLCDEAITPEGQNPAIQFGSNIPFTDFIAETITNGRNYKPFNQILGSNVLIVNNPAAQEDEGSNLVVAVQNSATGIAARFHYVMKPNEGMTCVADSENSNNWFLYSSASESISWTDNEIQVSWIGFPETYAVGLSVVLMTENQDSEIDIADPVYAPLGGYNSRACVGAANYVVK